VLDVKFQDATLVLLGHGSTLNADSAAPTYQHADELRKRGSFASVIEGFWKQEPGLAGVLRGAYSPRVFIVPLFISDGYFTEEVIPRELGFRTDVGGGFERIQTRGNQTLFYCEPVGTHASMTNVLLARAEGIIKRYPFPRAPKSSDITLFIAGHGTGNNENSRTSIERQVELIRSLNVYAGVHAVFMEEEPRIAECYALSQTRNIVVVPFFISDGLHSFEDIPVMLGEAERVVKARFESGQPTWRNPTEKKGKLVWYTQSIGNEPHIADVILERVQETADSALAMGGKV
jgi:sirohydrochlorin cobaltochelatase